VLSTLAAVGGGLDAADPPAAADDASAPAESALLARIAQVGQGVNTVTGHFTQRTDNPGETTAQLREGTFAIEEPDHYEIVQTRPDDASWKQRLCSDGQTEWEVEQTLPDIPPEQSSHPAGAADADLRRILECIRGDIGVLKRDYTIHAEPHAPGFRLQLTPLGAEQARSVSRITVDLDGGCHVLAIDVLQPGGARIVLEVHQAVYNQPVSADHFRLERR
jgi:hypothetical protein